MVRGNHPLAVSVSVFLAALFLMTSPAPGQEETRNDDAPAAAENAESAAEKIEQALDEKTSFKLDETPLREFVQQLRKTTGLNVLIDRQALDDVGIADEVPVSGELREISLRSALKILLARLDLAWMVQDGALVITTPEEAEARLRTKIYNVKDLIAADSGEEEAYQIDALLQAMTSTIQPHTWSDVGGPASIDYFRETIIITQTEDIHAHIAALLQALRAAAKATAAEDGAPASIRLASEAEEHIVAALEKPVTLDLEDASVRELPAILQEKLDLQAVLDAKALEEAGIAPDAELSLTVDRMPAGQALSHLLRSADLTWRVANEVLVITTPEEAEWELETRVYPVRDLCDFRGHRDFAGELLGRRDDDLMNAITGAIAPDTWDQVGGLGSIAPLPGISVLVISHTRDVHSDVEDFLTQLRKTLADQLDAPVADEQADPHALELVVYDLPQPLPAAAAAPQQNPGGGAQAAPPGGFFQFGGGFGGSVGPYFLGTPIPGEDLVEVVTSLVEPDSWNREGAYLKAVPGRLIVRQTLDVHRKIDALLVKLGLYVGDYGGFRSVIPVVGSRAAPQR